MYDKLVEYAAKQLELDASEITPDSPFESLGIDSLDGVEMIMDLESEGGGVADTGVLSARGGGCRRAVGPGHAVVSDRSCATISHEPCQAGNRAALSGSCRVPLRLPFLSWLRGYRAFSRFKCGCAILL